MSLIEQIHQAVKNGTLTQPFTAEEMKAWVDSNNVVKPDGSPYAEASIEAVLSNSDTTNVPTTNKNQKILTSSTNSSGKKEYWFTS